MLAWFTVRMFKEACLHNRLQTARKKKLIEIYRSFGWATLHQRRSQALSVSPRVLVYKLCTGFDWFRLCWTSQSAF